MKKTYYLTLSRVFPKGHPREGEATGFRESLLRALSQQKNDNTEGFLKIHTMRANWELWQNRFKKIDRGEAVLSVREWVGKPYAKGSSQREIALLSREDGIGIQKLRIKELDSFLPFVYTDKYTIPVPMHALAENDGLSDSDWKEWFRPYNLAKPLAIIHFTNFRYN